MWWQTISNTEPEAAEGHAADRPLGTLRGTLETRLAMTVRKVWG